MMLLKESKLGEQDKVHTEVVKLMGNRFEFTTASVPEAVAEVAIAKAIAEVQRIERLFTTFSADSQVNQINANAGVKPVKVDGEVLALIQRSLRIAELTDGAFDITYGGLDKNLWNFNQQMTQLPDKETAKNAVANINYRNVIINEADSTVYLKNEGMRIGFGGIGKGYAADRAKAVMLANGINNGIINAAGDLITWGTQPTGKSWTAGIADPFFKDKPFSWLDISNMAIATSGTYEKFAMIDGKKYSHTIDPKTGYPTSGIASVTMICPIAELADAMTTPVMVMGVEVGLNLINQMKNMACIIIDEQGKIHTSKNISLR
ncbi:FAD:protein FMN transferase [Nubsella zeaxanthinifaciens]|jgi:thiamine biosynthesis lipoprotein|uniref:FAD:protein FMN transferase n=1 Tax=Nubsella zeaxanthinifaciens TaxID=392412 RepID=UPI001F452693|nr:FAD:protein FMN transferase [Nubsella zeaxanthinifaciens]